MSYKRLLLKTCLGATLSYLIATYICYDLNFSSSGILLQGSVANYPYNVALSENTLNLSFDDLLKCDITPARAKLELFGEKQ